jgi:hypothetical protein
MDKERAMKEFLKKGRRIRGYCVPRLSKEDKVPASASKSVSASYLIEFAP